MKHEEVTIYDCVLDEIVPIIQATTEGIQKYWSKLPDDGYINHIKGCACQYELEKRDIL